MDASKYVIIGGGLAGGNAAVAIRERDPDGRIVLVTDEAHRPYDRVPLSKRYLTGALSRDGVFLRKQDFYREKKIEIRTGLRAQRLDVSGHRILFGDGSELGWERLLLATGGRPKKLNLPGADLPGIHYLRTIEDSDGIKDAMARSKRAVIVGGGFIGCEVAAACAQKGVEPTVVEMGPYLLNQAFDEPTGRWIESYLAARGVKPRTSAKVMRFVEQDGAFGGVELENGEVVPGDFAVVGTGVAPNEEIAQDAGLSVDRGILVDETLRASEAGIYAAGDVARFHSPVFDKHLRVEHYDVAVRQGKVAGANMAGGDAVFMEVPYFFSDLFDLKIHAYGDLADHDAIVLRGGREVTAEGGWVQFYLRAGLLVAYAGVNRKIKDERAAQKMIADRRSFPEPNVLADPATDLASLAEAASPS